MRGRPSILAAEGARSTPDAIVSGDADLLELEDPPVQVLTPHQFVERFKRLAMTSLDNLTN